MNDTFIKLNRKLPEINIDLTNGLLEIKGNSIPEDAESVYHPVVEELKKYINNPVKKTTINFHLLYFNTSTSKWLLYILRLIKILHDGRNKVEINWYYDPEDDEILETGRDFQRIIKTPIKFVKIK